MNRILPCGNRAFQLLGFLLVGSWIIGGCGGHEQGAIGDDPAPRLLSSEHLFDSSEHPELAERLVLVVGGFLQPDNALILVDPTELHLVDVVSGANRVVGRKGEGPEEFSRITDAFRTSEGVGVWDVLRSRVVFVAADGEFGYSQSFFDVPLRRKMFSLRPVAVRPDSHPVFRDGNGSTRERGARGRFCEGTVCRGGSQWQS